jgi:hypothetical protein
MSDIDKMLKTALSPTEYPSEELNEKIIKKMKENGDLKLKNKSLFIAAAIIICLLIPTSVYAAYRFLLPHEVAREFEDDNLGKVFEKDGTEVLQTVTDGAYKVTFLGHVTGKSISERTGSAWELHPHRTYVAVAIENADGSDITGGSNLFISPLIQGLRPWSFNIASMHGSYVEKVINGILYRIIECDNIEIFADKKLYLAISDTKFYSNDAFDYYEETGLITVNKTYEGTNILFDLELDTSKADSKKAEAYLKQLEEEWNPNSDNNEEADKKNPRVQQEIFTDKENGITFRVKDNNSSYWCADDTKSEIVLNYSFEVEGDEIESITYTLDKGEFCSRTPKSISNKKFYGNKCNITYDDQKKRDYKYSIIFRAKFNDYGYDPDYVHELGVKDLDARGKIYYEVLNKEIESTCLNLEIKMKDGRTIKKTLTFDNVLNEEGKSFWIAIKVN